VVSWVDHLTWPLPGRIGFFIHGLMAKQIVLARSPVFVENAGLQVFDNRNKSGEQKVRKRRKE
jgi:hypothetical protein